MKITPSSVNSCEILYLDEDHRLPLLVDKAA